MRCEHGQDRRADLYLQIQILTSLNSSALFCSAVLYSAVCYSCSSMDHDHLILRDWIGFIHDSDLIAGQLGSTSLQSACSQVSQSILLLMQARSCIVCC
jgi:hypothetical protein